MPKKRRPSYLKSPRTLSPSSSAVKDKPRKSVNELLTQLRHTSLASSSTPGPPASSHTNIPTVPPALRRILQIPETPAPRPRRAIRSRFDSNGRRLPAGPPPPRSWASPSHHHQQAHQISPLPESEATAAVRHALANLSLPGLQQPAPASLIGLALSHLAANWAFHCVYDQHYLYDIPCHLKPALMRELAVHSPAGLALGDIKALLLRPSHSDNHNGHHAGGLSFFSAVDPEITALDLTGSLGKSLTLRDVTALLFPALPTSPIPDDTQDSWDASDASEDVPAACLSHALVPNLTHISLAINPEQAENVSWRDLLNLAPRLRSVTHLSLAYWPEPCLLPSTRFATIGSPQGYRIPYGGTSYYSHSIDHDWSEALLVLKKLSRSLYTLEFLDLTGCASWFQALKLEDEHDFVDWVSNWGKITHLRLKMGWDLTDDALPSTRAAHREAAEMAVSIERHITAVRGGRGRFITVER